jgi:RNAse (barnase) inhibitor barstar
MANETKYLFYKTGETDNGKPMYRALAGQVASASGTPQTIDTSWDVVQRDVVKRPINQVFATDALTSKSGYYVVGPVNILLVNEKGEIQPTQGEAHDEALAQYLAYQESIVDVTAKPKSNRITLLDRIMGDKKFAPPSLEANGFYVDTELWYYLLRALWQKENVLLTGDTGTGKTELVQLVTNSLKMQCDIFDMAISNPTSALCGNHRINENGHSEFQYSRFALKIQEAGVKLLDELSRAAPAANNVLLPVTDSRRTLYIEAAMGESQVKVHEKACFWATANIGMQFVGTMALDSALMNRFERVDVTAPPMDKMVQVLQMRTKIDKAYALSLCEFMDEVNKSGRFSKGISPRQLIKAGAMVYDGYSVVKALEYTVLNQYDTDNMNGGERASVRTLIQKL